MPSWIDNIRNPAANVFKKYLFEMLRDKYPPHEEIVERVCLAVNTEKDMESFGKLLASIYEAGYTKAVGDYQGELVKLGYNVNVVPQTQAEHRIFTKKQEPCEDCESGTSCKSCNDDEVPPWQTREKKEEKEEEKAQKKLDKQRNIKIHTFKRQPM